MMYLKRKGFNSKFHLNPEKDTVSIGRQTTSDIQFTSTYVSRKHCEIKRVPPDGILYIQNCTKTNLTYVDEIILKNEDSTKLSIGSLIGLGIPLDLAHGSYLNDSKFVFLDVCQDSENEIDPEIEGQNNQINAKTNNQVKGSRRISPSKETNNISKVQRINYKINNEIGENTSYTEKTDNKISNETLKEITGNNGKTKGTILEDQLFKIIKTEQEEYATSHKEFNKNNGFSLDDQKCSKSDKLEIIDEVLHSKNIEYPKELLKDIKEENDLIFPSTSKKNYGIQTPETDFNSHHLTEKISGAEFGKRKLVKNCLSPNVNSIKLNINESFESFGTFLGISTLKEENFDDIKESKKIVHKISSIDNKEVKTLPKANNKMYEVQCTYDSINDYNMSLSSTTKDHVIDYELELDNDMELDLAKEVKFEALSEVKPLKKLNIPKIKVERNKELLNDDSYQVSTTEQDQSCFSNNSTISKGLLVEDYQVTYISDDSSEDGDCICLNHGNNSSKISTKIEAQKHPRNPPHFSSTPNTKPDNFNTELKRLPTQPKNVHNLNIGKSSSVSSLIDDNSVDEISSNPSVKRKSSDTNEEFLPKRIKTFNNNTLPTLKTLTSTNNDDLVLEHKRNYTNNDDIFPYTSPKVIKSCETKHEIDNSKSTDIEIKPKINWNNSKPTKTIEINLAKNVNSKPKETFEVELEKNSKIAKMLELPQVNTNIANPIESCEVKHMVNMNNFKLTKTSELKNVLYTNTNTLSETSELEQNKNIYESLKQKLNINYSKNSSLTEINNLKEFDSKPSKSCEVVIKRMSDVQIKNLVEPNEEKINILTNRCENLSIDSSWEAPPINNVEGNKGKIQKLQMKESDTDSEDENISKIKSKYRKKRTNKKISLKWNPIISDSGSEDSESNLLKKEFKFSSNQSKPVKKSDSENNLKESFQTINNDNIANIKKELLHTPNDYKCKSKHGSNKISVESVLPVKIKIEPDLEPEIQFKPTNNSLNSEDENDDIQVCYSQVDDVILISSEDESSIHDDEPLNSSFGPLPPREFDFEINVKTEEDSHYEDNKESASGSNLNNDDFFDLPDLTKINTILNEPDNLLGEKRKIMYSEPKKLKDNCNVGIDENDEDEDWWPALSQNFFSEDERPIENEKETEDKASNSHEKSLENLIEKINNRKTSKSKLTEPQGPPPRKKKGRKRLLENKVLSKSTLISKKNEERVTVPTKDTKIADSISEESNVSFRKSKVVYSPAISSSKKLNKAKDLRKALLKSHNLDAYKNKAEKEKHHLVSKHQSNKTKKLVKNTEVSKKQKENISIQPKPKESSTKVIKKGIAKVSKISRNQKLTEVDIFEAGNKTKPMKKIQSFKIPKKDMKNGNNIKVSCEQKSIVDKQIVSNNVLFDKPQPFTNENSFVNKNTSNNTNIESSDPRSILRTEPKHPSKMRYTVHFPSNQEELTIVKFISPRKKKDCFGPASVQQREIYFGINKTSNIPIIKAIGNPMEFIFRICNWNYDWLSTYKKAKEDNNKNPMPPEVCDNNLLPTFITYNSLSSYKQTFSNLMYYEIWEQIFKEWDQYAKTNTWFFCEIDAVKANLNYSLKFTTVKVLTLITSEMSRTGKHPATGSLIAMRYKVENKLGFIFGYVENIVKRRATCMPQRIKSNCPEGSDTAIVLEILCSKRYLEKIVKPGTNILLCNISYIRPCLRAFESLCNLNMSPLCPYILNPGDLSVFKNNENQEKYLIHQLEMNKAQKLAVMEVSGKCVREPTTPKLNIIHGPPGTGKTRVIIALISQINMLFKETTYASNRRILLCAPSNAAVDELVIRLAKLKEIGICLNIVRYGVKQSFHPEVKEFSFDVKVNKLYEKRQIPCNKAIESELKKKQNLCSKAAEDLQKAISEKKPPNEIKRLEYRLLELARSKLEFEKSCKLALTPTEKSKLHYECKKMVLMKAEVIATTLTSCLSGALAEVFGKSVSPFCCCIVDEAGQCKETEIWFPLQLGINKLVLVGDHLQLPATILSRICQGLKLHQSLFERWYHHIAIERHQFDLIHTLDVQYRMHEEILSWPALHFYNNFLTTGQNVTREQSHSLQPYLVFDVMIGNEVRHNKGEILNMTEVMLIRSLIEAQEIYLRGLSIGVLTPYQKQKLFLIDKLDHLIKRLKITVSTVDNFQGQEKDVIFCSFVRSNSGGNIGFVSDRQRLNVALTRARKSCFIIGDLSSLQTNDDWRSLIDNANNRNLVRKIQDMSLLQDKESLLNMSKIYS